MFDGLFFRFIIINKPLINRLHWLLHRLDKFLHLILDDVWSQLDKLVYHTHKQYIRWCGTGGFQEQGQCLFIGLAACSLFVSYCFPFLFFLSMGWCCEVGVIGLIGC